MDSSYLALSLVVTMQMHHQFKFVHTNKLSYWSNPGFYYTFLTYWTRFLLEPYIKNSNHIFRKNQYVLSPNIICLFPIISYNLILALAYIRRHLVCDIFRLHIKHKYWELNPYGYENHFQLHLYPQ